MIAFTPDPTLPPTRQNEELVRARREHALAFIAAQGEVTATELAAELRLASASGTIAHLLTAGLIKPREVTYRDSYGNFVKLYSLVAFAGPWREFEGHRIQPFRLAEHWPIRPRPPFDEEAYLARFEGATA